MRGKRTFTYARDYTGQTLVLVPVLGSTRPATIDPEDFERLRAEGLTDQWILNGCGPHQYVRCAMRNHRGRVVTVARLITGAPPGRCVKHMDKDRLNLRRSNLRVTERRQPMQSGVTP